MNANEIIQLLNLEPLPQEGGYFRQTYQSTEQIPPASLLPQFKQEAACGTAIYFLLTDRDFSAMHRLVSDEVYHFYCGDPLEILLLNPDGTGEICLLGNDLQAGFRPQTIVPKQVWQGACLVPNGAYGFSLVGTTMAPGFTWDGFELGDRQALIKQYPDFTTQIQARTH